MGLATCGGIMKKHAGIFEIQTKSGIHYVFKWRRLDGTQTSKTFHRLSDAVAHKREVDTAKSRGYLIDDRRAKVKFEDFAQEVFASLDHSKSTIRRRDGIMSKHLIPTFGSKAISNIRRTDVQVAVNSWRESGLAPRTIINHMNVLRPIFDTAVLEDIIVRNPTQGIKLPKPKEVLRNPLDPEQCQALIEAIDPAYTYAVHFALATGVRWEEFANMRIRDFNPFKNLVSITDSKTDAGVRVIPLDPEDTLRVSKHIADTGRTGANADSPLFTSPSGMPLHYSNFRRRVFIPACQKAGLMNVTFHDLRGTHATILVAEGHDVKVVQERMGHRSITTTLKYYARATEKGKLNAAGAWKRFLSGDNNFNQIKAQ
jgi:integrase